MEAATKRVEQWVGLRREGERSCRMVPSPVRGSVKVDRERRKGTTRYAITCRVMVFCVEIGNYSDWIC